MFVPGTLLNGDKYRDDLWDQFGPKTRFAQGEISGEFADMQFHDGDLEHYTYDLDTAALRSLGYPLRLDVALTLYCSLEGPSCDGCVTMSYTLTNRSQSTLYDAVVAFYTKIDIGDKRLSWGEISKKDKCSTIQLGEYRFVHCYDEDQDVESLSSVVVAALSQSHNSYTYQILPEDSLLSRVFDDVRFGVDVLYRQTDNKSKDERDIVLLTPVRVGDIEAGSSTTVRFAVIPIEAPLQPDSAFRVRDASRMYEYLTHITSVEDDKPRHEAVAGFVHSRSSVLSIENTELLVIRFINVTGRPYSLPVVGGSADITSLPLGVYIAVDDVGKVLQRLCLIE